MKRTLILAAAVSVGLALPAFASVITVDTGAPAAPAAGARAGRAGPGSRDAAGHTSPRRRPTR